jgi:hypothetical protein
VEQPGTEPIGIQRQRVFASGALGLHSQQYKLLVEVLQSSREAAQNLLRGIDVTAVAVRGKETNNPVATGVDSNVPLLGWDNECGAERTIYRTETGYSRIYKVINVVRGRGFFESPAVLDVDFKRGRVLGMQCYQLVSFYYRKWPKIHARSSEIWLRCRRPRLPCSYMRLKT